MWNWKGGQIERFKEELEKELAKWEKIRPDSAAKE